MVPWVVAKATDVALSGEQLSVAEHAPDAANPSGPWLPAAVPGTVLSLLVDAGKLPDPNIGIDSKRIPDVGDESVGPAEYTFWWCTSFPSGDDANAGLDANFSWLQLEGVNYSAYAYLNGTAISCSEPGSPAARGTFADCVLDVSQLLAPAGSSNFLALLVRPLDHPGDVSRGGQGGDHMIGADVTAQFLAGWDWVLPRSRPSLPHPLNAFRPLFLLRVPCADASPSPPLSRLQRAPTAAAASGGRCPLCIPDASV